MSIFRKCNISKITYLLPTMNWKERPISVRLCLCLRDFKHASSHSYFRECCEQYFPMWVNVSMLNGFSWSYLFYPTFCNWCCCCNECVSPSHNTAFPLLTDTRITFTWCTSKFLIKFSKFVKIYIRCGNILSEVSRWRFWRFYLWINIFYVQYQVQRVRIGTFVIHRITVW